MDRERLRRIRNYQNTEFYPALVLRPASVLVTMIIGDWRWVTPNLVTLVATVFRFAAAAMFGFGDGGWLVAGVIALQIGAVLDAVDGTLARYRRTPSNLGYFLDTVADALTWFATLAGLGWLAYRQTGDAHLLLVAATSIYALMVASYMKSVAETADERFKWKEAFADADPLAVVERYATRHQEGEPPPERTAADWVRWFARAVGNIWRFHEWDLFFWVGLLVLLDRVPALLWLLAITQTIAMLGALVRRGIQMHGYDGR